jgi:hypothetical protein
MLANNQEVRNRTPRSENPTQLQGMGVNHHKTNSNYTARTDLKASHSRYDKGMDLYKSGRVSIGANGFFKVSGFEVDTEKMQCECPDYRTRKQTCKHIFAAMLFVKSRGKQTIEHLDDHNNGFNGDGANPVTQSKHTHNKLQEANSKEFNRQATITRLAVINSAIELLKTHRKPIELCKSLTLKVDLISGT